MDSSEQVAPEPRTALKRAVAWRTASELVRHHPDLGLRIIETHPCDGGYDCVTVARMPDFQTLASFNIRGTGLLLGERGGRRRPGPSWTDDYPDDASVWRYPQHGLGEGPDGLAEAIEAFQGFPERGPEKPPLTPTNLSIVVIGELLGRVAFGSRPVDLRNAWFDSSGYSSFSNGPRPWSRGLPGVGALTEDMPWTQQAAVTTRYWSLDRRSEPEQPAVIVDLASSALWIHGKPETRLAKRFAGGQGIRALAWRLEQALDSNS